MIKILFFIENLMGGGAEKVLCSLVNAMDRSRFDITVQTLWKENPDRFLAPGIRYRYCYGEKNARTNYRSRIEAALGLTYRLHIRDDYDIEVAYLECGTTKIMAASTNKRAKKVAWVHCDLKKKMKEPAAFVRKAEKWYDRFDRIVCVSENVRQSFEELFDCKGKTTVIYNTVDDASIRRKAEAAMPERTEKRRLTAVTLGRLTDEKGYDRLLRVHTRLIQEGLAYDLWILGEGERRHKLESYIDEHALNDSVWLPGFYENPYPFLRVADLLVCSSRYEGFSTFVTEGMILGKPVITTDCSGMQELLGDSEFGMIVENNEEALLNGMRKMLTDASLREKFTAKAEERGRDFSTKTLVKANESFFVSLVGE